MMIYSQHFFRRRTRKIPSPSCLPIVVVLMLLLGVVVAFMPPVVSGVKVELPSLNTEPIEVYDDFIYSTIYVMNDEEAIVRNFPVNISNVGNVVKKIHKEDNLDDIKIFIKAERKASYETIMNILIQMNNIGIKDVSLVGKYIGKSSN